MKNQLLILLILLLFVPTYQGCQQQNDSPDQVSGKKQDQSSVTRVPVVGSIIIQDDKFIVSGRNLGTEGIKAKVIGQTLNQTLTISHQQDNLLRLKLDKVTKFAVDQIYKLIIENAYGDESVTTLQFAPLDHSVTASSIEPGAVFLQHFGMSGGTSGDIIYWNGSEWAIGPLQGTDDGDGPSGITLLQRGAGLVQEGNDITLTGKIAVNVGSGPNQILQLDQDGELILDNKIQIFDNGSLQFSFENSSTTQDYSISNRDGIFRIFDNTAGADRLMIDNSGITYILGELQVDTINAVNWSEVCLIDGTNCPTIPPGTVTKVYAGDGMISGLITNTGTINLDPNTEILNRYVNRSGDSMSGNLVSTAEIQAPLFRDEQTNFFIDPASSSTINGMQIDGGLSVGDGVQYTQTAGEVRANIFRDGDTSSFVDPASASTINSMQMNGGLSVGESSEQYQQVAGEVRAARFRDKDTSYYAEPAGTSFLNALSADSTVSLTNVLRVGGTDAYGDTRLSIWGSSGNNDSTFATAKEDGSANPIFAITPEDSGVSLSAGVYLNNGSWSHDSDDGNNQRFVLDPGNGVRWYASANSSASWNSSSNRQLWNDSGTWVAPINIGLAGNNANFNNSLDADDLAANSVNESEIATNAVRSDEVLNNSLTSDDLATNSVTASEIATSAVGSDEVLNNSLTADDLASNSVNADEISTDAVGAAEIAANAVGTSEVSDNSLTANDLADNSVTAAEIAANAVGSSEVIDNSLTASDLADNSVGAAEIATSAVGTDEVNDNTLTANDLAANSVTASEIATGAVGSDEVNDNTLTANDLAANSVTASEIATGAVGSDEVSDNTLTANDLAADSVTASEIATNAVGSDEIASNAVGADEITTGAVGADEITTGAVGTDEASFTNQNLLTSSSPTFVSVTQTSDLTLKKKIVTIPDALMTIKKLRGVYFEWKANDQKDIGLIAQEVQEVIPELVSRNSQEGYLGVKYSNIVGLVIEAIKQQHKIVTKNQEMFEIMHYGLQDQVDELKRQLASITSENADHKDEIIELKGEVVELKHELAKIKKFLNLK